MIRNVKYKNLRENMYSHGGRMDFNLVGQLDRMKSK